ncbi:MAG TPA: prolyl oligopeptidase family serine peptidase [Sedimentisphaerales bacterium]|nr:prolyl oligopeptidase family serine peptidase [Sedimentisphaerales bacterium]HRS11989.1 prolyl oligopeptidase family serine peptidase [Sedimentisphaerales bacterium]HRV49045.1 prolyl oligopeptidase family serine peptidase [Sedimentisphaerales bacterium]
MRDAKRMGLLLMLVWSLGMWGDDAAMGAGQSEQKLRTEIARKVEIDYLLYLPEGYGEKDQKWPLMLFLHGAGERGDNLDLVKKHGPAKLVEQGKNYPFIVVSPQCPSGQWWTEKTDALMALLDEIELNYAVDSCRIYLTGLSMGGFGTWTLACRHPERFAAIAPICGGGEWYLADRLQNVPVWAFHGAQDSVVPLALSQTMVQAVERAGGSAKLTVYPEANHDSWTATYDNPELYEWFLSHRLNRSGQRAMKLSKEVAVEIEYLLYLPEGYGETSQDWPLLLFLHGAGERGDDLDKVKVHGPPKLVAQGKSLPFIIASPQCPNGRSWTDPAQMQTLIALLDDLVEKYQVDESRVYLTGLSMGGYGTWALGASCPERFAALVPICGGGQPRMARRLRDVPIWVFHGAKDTTVPLSQSEEMVEALKAAGGNVEFTVYPEAQHDSWTATYDNPKLYEWLLSHRKGPEQK